tara:strand:+ start:1422 stop:1814 length:393 start_codon:yes stop_codon:yes gene_type:complete
MSNEIKKKSVRTIVNMGDADLKKSWGEYKNTKIYKSFKKELRVKTKLNARNLAKQGQPVKVNQYGKPQNTQFFKGKVIKPSSLDKALFQRHDRQTGVKTEKLIRTMGKIAKFGSGAGAFISTLFKSKPAY